MTEPQRTTRLGCFTASNIWQIMKSGRSKDKLFGEQAMTYIYERLAEYITGETKQQASSMSLDWGNNNEKDAALWLQNEKGIEFTYHGKENFIYLEYNQFAGGSPDGLSEDAVIEIKCPFNSANHIKTLLAAKMPPNTWVQGEGKEPDEFVLLHNDWLRDEHYDYYCQLQFNMLCANKQKGIYATYDPRTINPEHRMAVLYIERDEVLLDELKRRLDKAVEIVTNELTKLNYLK